MSQKRIRNQNRIITTTFKNGRWKEIEKNNYYLNNSNEEDISNFHIYDNTNDISNNSQTINRYNNKYYICPHKIKIINNTQNEKFEYGNVIEERRNYKLYISGFENAKKDNFKEDYNKLNNNIKTLKYCNNQKFIKNSPSLESYDCKDIEINNNINNYSLNSKIIRNNREVYSPFSNKRNNINYIYFSSPTKRIYKTPYNLKNKGIIKDNLYGKFYKVFQAIPADIDINNESNYKIYNEQNYSDEKIKNINYKNNYFNSLYNNNNNDKDKLILYKKPILKRANDVNYGNIHNESDYNNKNPKYIKKIKSLYLKNKSYSNNCKGNPFICVKEFIKINQENRFKEESNSFNNNNYIEIIEGKN